MTDEEDRKSRKGLWFLLSGALIGAAVAFMYRQKVADAWAAAQEG